METADVVRAGSMTPMDIAPTGDAAKYGNTDKLYRTLSSWQGVLLGIGTVILEVKVTHLVGEPTKNKNMARESERVPNVPRRGLKIAALAQAYTDKLILDNYILTDLSLRDKADFEMDDNEWEIQVSVATKSGDVMNKRLQS